MNNNFSESVDRTFVLIDRLFEERGLARCATICEIVNTLSTVKRQIDEADANYRKEIESLKRRLIEQDEIIERLSGSGEQEA